MGVLGRGLSKLRRQFIFGLVGLLTAVMLANCSGPRSGSSGSSSGGSSVSNLSRNADSPAEVVAQLKPLPEVPALPSQEIPDWIEQVSPTGAVDSLSQIRVRFAEPLVAVEALESPERQAILDKFAVFPDIPGQFRFLTPRMVGFQADRAIPQASRLQVTLKSGLADLAGHRLDQDVAWTFSTEPIQLSDLPGVVPGTPQEERRYGDDDPIELKPTLAFQSNAPLDLKSLGKHLSLSSASGKVPVNVALASDDDSQSARRRFDAADHRWAYQVTPKKALQKATQYDLTISPGLLPAGGNLALAEPVTTQVKTYAPLAFEGLERIANAGRFADGLPQLMFNNGLLAESAAEHISISPAPREGTTLVRAYDNDTYAELNPWALEPQTQYQITIDGGLEDRFGQTLGETVMLDYRPGDLAADIWAPTGLNVFPANQDVQLNLSAVNLPDKAYQAAFKVVQPTDLVTANDAYPRSNRPNLLPDKAQWTSVDLKSDKNAVAEIPIPLREQLGGKTGMLAYGMTARTQSYKTNEGETRWQEPDYYGLVQLTNLGLFSQWFPESGLVRVNHLSDGAAVENATVEVYRSYVNSENPPASAGQVCATGKTGTDGTANFDAAALKGCMEGADSFESAPNLLVVAREGEDWAHVHSQSWSGSYGYGLYAGWDSNKPQSRGTVFSDRFLYQPGETAWLTGMAYYLKQGKLLQDKNKTYDLVLNGPDGNQIDLGRQTTNDFGTFSVPWEVESNQPLGYYGIEAKSSDGLVISGDLRVAEFKPPNFQVELSLEDGVATAGQTVQAQVQSDYLFGAPVQGGAVNYYVTRRPADLQPQGWEGFRFGPQWYWPEEEPALTTDVLETSDVLSTAGDGSLSFEIAEDLPFPATYRIDAEVIDASNLAVADSQTVTALPGKAVIGLESSFGAEAGKALEVRAIAVTPDGQPQAGQSINLALERINYSSVTQVVAGSNRPQYQVEYEPVAEQTIRSGKQAKTVTFTPEEAGSYRIRATFTGQGEATATDTRVWVSGDRPIYWGNRYRNNRLEVKLDKEQYAPGETATAFIQSPYDEGELYFAVVRHDRLLEKIIPVTGGVPQVQFTVTPEMLPNAAVEAVLVRQGESLERLEEPGAIENLVAMGFEPFKVDLTDQYLDLEVTPVQPELRPAVEQTVKLALKDKQGQPLSQGQFTVMVVDEAVLQLSGHRPPDLVETVYAEQDISTRFADNRPDVVLQTQSSPLQKGWGYGGGFSAGGESTRIRRNFLPLAYFNGSVLTDQKGEAEVSFTLPDNLTTWRVMAVATDGDLHFGQGEATFVTTQPLITAPVLPQFVRPGDRLLAGLSVTNTSDQTGKLEIESSLANGLKFSKGKGTKDNGARKLFSAKASDSTQAYRFPMEVNGDGIEIPEATLQFQTQLGNEQDAFELPLAIAPLTATEQVVEAGTTDQPVTIPLNLGNDVAPDVGGLDVLLSSTVLSDIQAPVQQLEWTEDLPNLNSAASRLSIAANLKTLSQTYGQVLDEFDAEATAAQALEKLQALQQPDGGFSSWPGFERSDPFVTSYAAQALGAAQTAGITLDSAMVSQVQSYLASLLTNPAQVDWCESALCKAQLRLESLTGLAALGDLRQDFLADLYAQREQLDTVGQIQLARQLSPFDNWQAEADSLSNQLQATVYETARSAVVNLPDQWGWFHSPVASQAELLRLAIARSDSPETLKRLTDGLLNLRRNGTWQTTYDNAQALEALVAYAQQSPEPPNFTATVDLKGKQLASQAFKGYQQSGLELSVPMAELPKGKSELNLGKAGQGLLHYLTAYRYRPQGNPPGRLQGLRITRSIHPANGKELLYQQGLTAAKPTKLPVGEVFDIGLEIVSDHPVNHVVITDPLPAGLEPVDSSFQTTSGATEAQQDSWEIAYQELGGDRILAYADQLDVGIYELHYLARSVTPGRFLWPGAEVSLEHAPEEFGRTAAVTLELEE